MKTKTRACVSAEPTEPSGSIVFRECNPSEECLFHGTDEVGREGWFLRLAVTGMYIRRCGPFVTRERALEILERFAGDVDEALTEITNWIHTPEEIWVMEGVPNLVATRAQRHSQDNR